MIAQGPEAAPLDVVEIDVSSRLVGVLQQQLHQLGAGLLTGEHLALGGQVGEGLPEAGIRRPGPGC